MVVSDQFVWAHIGKTGGDFTAAAFRKIKSAQLHQDWRYDWRKHETFQQRQTRLGVDFGSRKRVANIRRLPAWCLSFANHIQRNFGLRYSIDDLSRGVLQQVTNPSQKYLLLPPSIRRSIYRFAKLKIKSFNPDSVLNKYEPGRVDHWLRLESIETDFVDIVGQFVELDSATRQAIVGMMPKNDGGYDRNVNNHLCPQQIHNLYQSCPIWREVELAAYGSLMTGE